MKKIELALCVSMALFAPVLVGSSAGQSATWTATSSPIQATITNGPWNLSQGGSAPTGGAYDGTIPYCTQPGGNSTTYAGPGGASGGTPLINGVNGPSTTNLMNPYYFPFVTGSGQNVKGFFDYRPKEINEAVVAATSTNAGQSWTFEQIVEQLTSECPNSDSNTADDTPTGGKAGSGNPAGNDDGEGHATIISSSGTTWVYTLDRRTPHVDSDGLIVHNILPRGVNALGTLPLNSPAMQPPAANVIAGWNFNSDTTTATTYGPGIDGTTGIAGSPSFNVDPNPAPSTNNVTTGKTPKASALGMTNNYTYATQAATVGAAGTGYAVGDTGTFGSSGGQYTVTSVKSGGAVKNVTVSAITSPNYTVNTTYNTSVLTGSGNGALTLKITGTQTTGSIDGDDVTATTLSSDPSINSDYNELASANVAPNDNNAWRVRGVGTASSGAGSVVGAANTGNGWNLAAPPCTQGAEFDVDTTGFHYIVFQYDWYTTNQGVRDLQALYTTDGSHWTPVGPIQVSGGGSAFNNQITINFHALQAAATSAGNTALASALAAVENNPNFGVRLVSVYDPSAVGLTPAYSIPAGGNVCSYNSSAPNDPTQSAQGTYTAASLASNNQPVVYNNNSGNWRFDEVNVLGTAGGSNPITSDPIVNTTGLVNPDGILAIVPGTSPVEVLYISKTLNSDYLPPTNYPLCPASIPNGNFNDDVEVVRIATTTNFVNFTDITPLNSPAYATSLNASTPQIQMVNGLSDPSTISYSGIRWVSPNGTLIKLSNGNWGLFFGGGNCLDGDSDAFHAIMYAESSGTDLTNWTVINGINNPIASLATVSNVTDPQSGQTVTIPANTPVVCQFAGSNCTNDTLPWFGGRVYAPQAIVTSPSTVSLVFAGYNAGFQLGGSSRDLSSYRNIGQVNLSVSGVTLP